MNEFTRKALDLADAMTAAHMEYQDSRRSGEWASYEAARAALLAHLEGGEQRPGWVSVPKEPTAAMMIAFNAGERYGFKTFGDRYAAMIAATPTEESP